MTASTIAHKSDRRAEALPALPATLPSVLGTVPVSRVEDLRDSNGKSCLGIWRVDERDVRIEAKLAPVAAWATYWHEWAHVALWDGGVELKASDAERICDAVATARVREMLDAR